MNRIQSTFERLKSEHRTGIALYLTVGFPDRAATLPLLTAMVEGGVDFLELGVPFSDPMADGATIQRANQAALRNNITLKDCLEVCAEARRQFSDVPILMMGYYNPLLSYGLEQFAKDGAEAGLDGLILVDLPPEESGPVLEACRPAGMEIIYLLAPTSTGERLRIICTASTSLIYCVSVTGVTGARREVASDLPEFIARVRKATSVPLVVGFGISTRAHVEAVGEHADSVAVGSALIRLIDDSPPSQRTTRVREYVEELAGRRALAV